MRWPKVERMYATPPKDWPYEICGSPGFINHHYLSSKLYQGIVWTNWVPPTMILVGSMFWWSTDPSHLPLAIRLVPPVTQFTLCVRSASAITEQSVVQVDVTMQSFDIFTPACVRAPWWSLLCSRPCVCAHQHFHSQSSDSWESLSWGKTIVWQIKYHYCHLHLPELAWPNSCLILPKSDPFSAPVVPRVPNITTSIITILAKS